MNWVPSWILCFGSGWRGVLGLSFSGVFRVGPVLVGGFGDRVCVVHVM